MSYLYRSLFRISGLYKSKYNPLDLRSSEFETERFADCCFTVF